MYTFYPFVDNGTQEPAGAPHQDQSPSQQAPSLQNPAYPARIAVYDDMAMPPRVIVIEPKDIRTYLQEIVDTVYRYMQEKGGQFAYMMIRELVENFIHAYFIEPTISILDSGRTLEFCDQGPGIQNKQAAVKPSFTSATREMKQYIRGVGSGLPIVEEYIKNVGGTITIEDNLEHGTLIRVSIASTPSTAQTEPGSPQQYSTPQGSSSLGADAAQQQAQPVAQTPRQASAVVLRDYQRDILALFITCERVGVKELTAQLSLSAATASRRLKELAEMGLIEKSGQKYELTHLGRETLAALAR